MVNAKQYFYNQCDASKQEVLDALKAATKLAMELRGMGQADSSKANRHSEEFSHALQVCPHSIICLYC